MKRFHLLFALGLAAPLAACVAHGQVTGTVTTGEVYQEPPAPQVEEAASTRRAGFVWIGGRWDWRNNAWAWQGGHWERERREQIWVAGSWEKRGNAWRYTEGHWAAGGGGTVVVEPPPVERHEPPPVERHEPPVVVSGGGDCDPGYPCEAPPPPRPESPGVKAGFIWMGGHWDWHGNKYDWTPGHWERQRSQGHYEAGRWEHQGRRWVWIEGSWR